MQAKFLCDNAGVVSIGVTDALVDRNYGMRRLLCKTLDGVRIFKEDWSS